MVRDTLWQRHGAGQDASVWHPAPAAWRTGFPSCSTAKSMRDRSPGAAFSLRCVASPCVGGAGWTSLIVQEGKDANRHPCSQRLSSTQGHERGEQHRPVSCYGSEARSCCAASLSRQTLWPFAGAGEPATHTGRRRHRGACQGATCGAARALSDLHPSLILRGFTALPGKPTTRPRQRTPTCPVPCGCAHVPCPALCSKDACVCDTSDPERSPARRRSPRSRQRDSPSGILLGPRGSGHGPQSAARPRATARSYETCRTRE
jgi:hypothetical protein